MRFSLRSPKFLFVLLSVLVALLVVAVLVFAFLERDSREEEPQEGEQLPGWQAVASEEQGQPDRITNELYLFSAEAPAGWRATNPNSQLAGIEKEDFTACKITTRLTENSQELSASGLTAQLNAPGKQPPDVRNQFSEVIYLDSGLWPAAKLTVFTQTEGKRIEVHTPRGELVFIAQMKIEGAINEEKNLVPHPRLAECEKAFSDYLATIHFTG